MTSEPTKSVSPFRNMLQGIRDTLPLTLAAVPFGILYGVLAEASGLSTLATIGMSAMVFAASSQFIAVTMLATGVAWPAILLATFFVNLRHMLYAAALVPHARHFSQFVKVRVAFCLTDETFAVVSARLRKNKNQPKLEWFIFGSGLIMYINWILCTVIGLSLGRFLPGMQAWGLEVAMIVAFVGIIAPMLVKAPMWVSSITASICSVLTLNCSNQSGLIISGLAGVAAGIFTQYLIDIRKKKAMS